MALAEAGVAVLVERLGAARERGARIHGEVLGYAITSDACGIGRMDPDGEGLERAMRLALERSGVVRAGARRGVGGAVRARRRRRGRGEGDRARARRRA